MDEDIKKMILALAGHPEDVLREHGIVDTCDEWCLDDEVWWQIEWNDDPELFEHWLDKVEGLCPGIAAPLRGLKEAEA